jgi:photoactive yellow protein
MTSMEHQLEAPYRERETRLHHGFSSADEAVHRLQTQQRQIDALQRENHTYEQQFDRLESELGTRRVPRIVELVRALESDADTSLDDLRPEPTASPESTDYGVDIGATSPFVDAETLDRLDDMTDEELAELDVGAIRLREDGTVEDLNETALQLPGLRSVGDPAEIIGENFFLDLAPSTNNNLFFGRFRKGQRRGKMDARFPYTFTSPEEGPQSFAVHLYRPPDSDTTWLLFRPA